jgi:hypothetical protein
MSNPPNKIPPTTKAKALRKLAFTHGIEVENFITNKRGDILEDGKELVAVWDQMFNGALNFLKSLTSSSTNVPEYIRRKIKRVTRKDVERHGKIIRYVQIQYLFNGKSIDINVFGPDPNISQITWLLELVTPPCEYLEELDWWINTLYLAASRSIAKGYHIQPLGFNPYQTEYRAGVTCGEHHHLGGFKSVNEKKAAYNMIRAYIPHLIALSNTSPFIDGKPDGRTILKKGDDGRTLILAPDCVRSHRLKENSGQLGPNIPEYLPYVGPSFTRQQFSRYVRKEIPDDRYVDAFPFTSYDTIECRFFDAQYDQNIRKSIIILLQALALKAIKLTRAGKVLPDVKGNTLYEHRKRAVNFGMFAKFQGDPSIESSGGEFVKHYNHNPETGGPPGKIYESLRSLLIWLKPEFRDLKVNENDLTSILIMLWGTARIAPPISSATYMFYLFENNHGNIASVISSLSLINGKPRKSFTEVLGRPQYSMADLISTNVAKPVHTADTTRSSLARKLQLESRQRRKKIMVKEKARLQAKQSLKTKMIREKVKKEREIEKKRQDRLSQLEKAKKPPPKPVRATSDTRSSSSIYRTRIPFSQSRVAPRKTVPIKTTKRTTPSKPTAKKVSIKAKPTNRKPTKKAKAKRGPPVKRTARKQTRQKKVLTTTAISNRSNSIQTTGKKPVQAYASTASRSDYSRRQISIPKPTIAKQTTTKSVTRKKSIQKKATASTKAVSTQTILQYESYRDTKFIKSLTISNMSSRIDYGIIVPVIKMKWRKSIIQSMVTYPIIVEAQVSSLDKRSSFQTKAFQETINLEKSSLRDTCYLPIPIDINSSTGEFHVKFIVRDGKKRNILGTEDRTFSRTKISSDKKHQITRLSIPPNQVGDSKVNVTINASKNNTRGKITLWGISQRGIMKFYEKKAKFGQRRISLDLPILIPPSMCSSQWMLYLIFNARGASISAYTKTSPPLSKIINFSLSGNPPLRSRIYSDFHAELTPKLIFRTRCEISEIDIFQVENRKGMKYLKKYRLKSRINKGEKFVLESFEWKAPSMRKGLFGSHKQKSIEFYCRIFDNLGEINDSLIGIVETPSISVFKK